MKKRWSTRVPLTLDARLAPTIPVPQARAPVMLHTPAQPAQLPHRQPHDARRLRHRQLPSRHPCYRIRSLPLLLAHQLQDARSEEGEDRWEK